MSDYVEQLLTRHSEASMDWYTIGEYEFRIKTPNQFEAMRTVSRYADGATDIENIIDAIDYCAQYVHDWKGVSEADIVPGGDAQKPVPFDHQLLDVLLEDNIKAGDGIVGKVFELIAQRQEETENEKKH